eukprot:1326796-Amphidinium_carterae.1
MTVYDSIREASNKIVKATPMKGKGQLRASWISETLWAQMLAVRESRSQLARSQLWFERGCLKVIFDAWLARPVIQWFQLPVLPVKESLQLIRAGRHLERDKRREKKLWLRSQGVELDLNRASNNRAFYQTLKRLTKRSKGFAVAAVKDSEDRPCVTIEQRNAMWLQHWGEHYGANIVDWGDRPREDVSFDALELHPEADMVCEREVVLALKCFKTGKAVPDGVTSEILRAMNEVTCAWLCVVHTKILRTAFIPWELNGGYVAAVPKTHPPSVLAGNYRGILVLPVVLKILERVLLWRLQLQTKVSDMQFGNVGTALPSWILERKLEFLRQNKTSHAVVFVDVAAAFDAVVREWITGDLEALAELPRLQSDVKESLCEDVRCNGGVLERQGVQPYLIAAVRALHKNTWMSVSRQGASDCVLNTVFGERQGGVLSPTLFDLAQDLVLADVDAALRESGVLLQQDSDGVDGRSVDSPVAFKDDCFIVISHDSPAALLRYTKVAVETIYEKMRLRGFRVNVKPQKTVIMTRLYNEEGRRVMEGLRLCAPRQGALIGKKVVHISAIAHDGTGSTTMPILVMSRHIHLGRVAVATGSLMPEVRSRVGKARAAWRAFNTKALRESNLSMRSWRVGFMSLVLSVLIVGFESSRRLTKAEYKGLNKFFVSCVQSMSARFIPGSKEVWKIIEGTALQAMALPSLSRLLMHRRLNFVSRVTKSQNTTVARLLELESPWRQGLVQDIECLAKSCTKVADLGEPRDSLDVWFALAKDYPSAWKVYTRSLLSVGGGVGVRQVSELERELEHMLDNVEAFADLFEKGEDAEDVEGPEVEDALGALCDDVEGQQEVQEGSDKEEVAEQTFVCGICAKACRSLAGLGSHTRSRHGIYSDVSMRVQDSNCPSCNQCYETRAIAIQHLRE